MTSLARSQNTPSIIRDPFTLIEGSGFKLTSLRDKHAKGFGADYGAWNIIFVLESEGLRICHWGDNQPDLTAQQIASLGRIDVLILPVEDGAHLLEHSEVKKIIAAIQPKVIFPVHYHVEGITNPEGGLTGITAWLARQKHVRHIESSSIDLSLASLPQAAEVWTFSDKHVVAAVLSQA